MYTNKNTFKVILWQNNKLEGLTLCAATESKLS